MSLRIILIVVAAWTVIAYTFALRADSKNPIVWWRLTFLGGAMTLIYNVMGQVKGLALSVRVDWVAGFGLVSYTVFAIGLTGAALWARRNRS